MFNKTLEIKDIAPSIVIAFSFFALIANDSTIGLFEFERNAITNMELWRLFTAHFFHTNLSHFILNMCGLVLLYSIHRKFYNLKNFAALLLVAAVIVSVGVYFSSPHLTSYVGLSGALHTLLVWGALKDIQLQDKTGYLLLLGVLVKVGYEQFFGASEQLASLIDANVAIDAHLWGTVAGIVYFGLTERVRNKYIKDVN